MRNTKPAMRNTDTNTNTNTKSDSKQFLSASMLESLDHLVECENLVGTLPLAQSFLEG